MTAKKITNRSFFTCSAEELAPKLLGKNVCHKESDGFVIKCRIRVTEAYPTDDVVNDAVRAAKAGKKTSQLSEGGRVYVKSTRGSCRFDIIAGQQGDSESVLIRGLDSYAEGPFIASDALNITPILDGTDLLSSDSDIWIEEDGTTVEMNPPTTRIGLSESQERLLRFSAKSFTFE